VLIDGLNADVVTLALAADIDEIAENAKLLPAADWQRNYQITLRLIHQRLFSLFVKITQKNQRLG
jgi:ABC-type sulfate transport system substrate-binding protein